MKEPEKSSKKYIGELRKHSISQKTRSDNANQFGGKEEQYFALLGRDMKSLGRKYMQQNVFKGKEKDHHEIVISDELVRNSKQFRLLREKLQMKQAVFSKEFVELNEVKSKLKQEIAEIKSSSYNSKLSLWELKNQILQLKGILNDQQNQSRRLEQELNNPQQQYYSQDENQYKEQQNNQPQQQQEQVMEEDKEQYDFHQSQLRINSQQRQPEDNEEMDIRLVVSEMNTKLKKMNPENLSASKIDIHEQDLD